MADAIAFAPPEGQSEYAFPAGQGGQDEAAAAEQRNQQIQQSFDSQRFQRAFIQNIAKSMANQGAQIERLSRQQAEKSQSKGAD